MRALEAPLNLQAMKSYPMRIVAALVCSLMVGCATAQKQASAGSDDGPNTEALLAFALSAYAQGESAAALAALEYVLDREPGNRKAEYYMGLILESQAQRPLRGPQVIYPTIPPQVVTR
jgi:Tfp pilus assembly protein PilF